MVDRAFVVPPVSQIGPVTPEQRAQLIATSLVAGQYEQAIDRESAFEILSKRAEERMPQSPPKRRPPPMRRKRPRSRQRRNAPLPELPIRLSNRSRRASPDPQAHRSDVRSETRSYAACLAVSSAGSRSRRAVGSRRQRAVDV